MPPYAPRMRRCSRCSEAVSRLCFSGSGTGRASATLESLDDEQAASVSESAKAAARRRMTPPRSRIWPVFASLMTALRDLDLSGMLGLDPWAAALLDQPPHPNMLAGQLL